MSFSTSSGDALPSLKKFVTEDELVEKRKQRQEEWEKVRKPDEPLEVPEEEIDSRCLFSKLEEQKQKKQDEFDDKHRLSNQVKGLDDDEAQFLDLVSQKQQEITRQREQEDTDALTEYRNARMSEVVDKTATKTTDSKKSTKLPTVQHVSQGSKKSQLALLAGAVKRKSQDSKLEHAEEPEMKKLKDDNELSSSSDAGLPGLDQRDSEDSLPGLDQRDSEDSLSSTNSGDSTSNRMDPSLMTAQVIGILPGLGAYYGESTDSDSTSSDSDVDIIVHTHRK